jgi:hypothetical protein
MWDARTVTSGLAGHQATIWERMGGDSILSKKAGETGSLKKPRANSAIAAAIKDLPPATQAAILALVNAAGCG